MAELPGGNAAPSCFSNVQSIPNRTLCRHAPAAAPGTSSTASTQGHSSSMVSFEVGCAHLVAVQDHDAPVRPSDDARQVIGVQGRAELKSLDDAEYFHASTFVRER